MRIPRRWTRWVVTVVCVTLVLQLAACGTLIHPERRGQDSGRIDPAIAILDGIGLLFFVIPGLIAYAVDFSTGAIYLPGTERSEAPPEDGESMKDEAQNVVYVDPEDLDAETIERVLREHAGVSVDLDEDYVEAYRYESRTIMLQEMAKANHEIAARETVARATKR